ncbi:hypothetical protein MMC06_005075 [Schaereria dolodes]|nr:hypothetical protein [Schaereria dolodes]
MAATKYLKLKHQTVEELINPSRDSDAVTSIIEPSHQPFFLSRHFIKKILYFEATLANGHSIEDIENKIMLPEHDVYLWKKAFEFLQTGGFAAWFKKIPEKNNASRVEVQNILVNFSRALRRVFSHHAANQSTPNETLAWGDRTDIDLHLGERGPFW